MKKILIIKNLNIKNGELIQKKNFLITYMNGMKEVMDSYWKEVVSTVDNTDTVVLYQGDHGVNIVPDKGNRGEKRISLTHCEFSLNHYKELYNTIGLL